MALIGIPISETECIGDSLSTMNKAFTALDARTAQAFFPGETDLDLQCKKLIRFGVDVKEVTISAATPNQKYVIDKTTDCGKVITIISDVDCFVTVPVDLPVGFNIMIISNSEKKITIQNDVANSGVVINNIDDRYTIRGRYGICNFICRTANTILISGDLTA